MALAGYEVKMLNKDKRSVLFCCVLGDGCLSNWKPQNSGVFVAEHGIAQKDYVEWKKSLLQNLGYGTVYTYSTKQGRAWRLQLANKKIRVWKKFTYKHNKKNLPLLLSYIRHPELATAIWLMDDGYCEGKKDKKTGKVYSSAFRLFTCEASMEDQAKIISWFETTLGVSPTIKFQKRSAKNYNPEGADYPYLRFTGKDSMIIWQKIRPFVLQFESMCHKFRHMEHYYQRLMTKCEPVVND
jgi:hypothetical protein